jgi:hypothetical protein
MALELYEVKFNPSLNPAEFIYNPSGLEVTDATDEFLK